MSGPAFRFVACLAACAGAVAFALDQEQDAPPAIAQWGITNWASRTPPQLASGGIAPGSLIRIRGWRLGENVASEHIMVRIRKGETVMESAALSAAEGEIEARVPPAFPVGSASLQVVRNGQASLEWPVAIVESSYGASSRNGQGWGPGEVTNAGGAPNSAERPAQPGSLITLAGTGLGAPSARRPLQVWVGGKLTKGVRATPLEAARAGIDRIAFTLPDDTPEGCYVPIQVSSAPGIYSNTVTLAVTRSGAACASSGNLGSVADRKTRLGTVGLLHADLELAVSPTQNERYPVDLGFASFAEIEAGTSANPLLLFPPAGTCVTYSGTAGLHSITSPLAALESLPGKPLDAGSSVSIEGSPGTRLLRLGDSLRNSYRAVMGGHAPVPGAKETPLFLAAGDYRVEVAGGAAVRGFRTGVRVSPPIEWRNREQVAQLDRARGVSVTWQSSLSATPAIVLIVAMNVDSRSGALGVCGCLANARDGRFQIPAYALANIPVTPAHPRGFPLNLMALIELPETLPSSAAGSAGLDRLLAFAASISGRTVQFK